MTSDDDFSLWLARLRRDEVLASYQHQVLWAEFDPEHFVKPASLSMPRRRKRPYEFTARQMEIATAAVLVLGRTQK